MYRDLSFYARNAERFADIASRTLEGRYAEASVPGLDGDGALLASLMGLVRPGSRGLDAGCGPGGRDVALLAQAGYDVLGVDAVAENIAVARRRNPALAGRFQVHDLRTTLPFASATFQFCLCNAVMQHMTESEVFDVLLPELARVLTPGGVLQLMFKCGDGLATWADAEYAEPREFRLYPAEAVLEALAELELRVIERSDDHLGGVMFFTDPKAVPHCVLFARRWAERERS